MGLYDVTRTIEIPGDDFLPPAYEPQFPSDLGPDEVVRIIPPKPPFRPQGKEQIWAAFNDPSLYDRRYFKLQDAYTFKSRPDWINSPPGGLPQYGQGRGFSRVPDVPVMVTERANQKLPDFWNGPNNLLMMSERLLQIVLDFDAEAIVHRPVMIQGPKGEPIEGSYFMVDVVRVIPAIDVANSTAIYVGGGPKFGSSHPRFLKFQSARVRDDLDPGVHIFRQTRFAEDGRGTDAILSAALKEAIAWIKPKARNIDFGYMSEGII